MEFPESTLQTRLINNKSSTHIPIPITTDRCEKKCCSISTIPLRVCKAITIYKSQGITIGEDKVWKRVVVCLPTGRQRKTPGAELVGFSRATEPGRLAIGNRLCDLDRINLLKLGTSIACQKRIEFETYLTGLSQISQVHYTENITQLNPFNIQTFEGGCEHLLQWYNSLI